MLKKPSVAIKTCSVFSIDCSLIFRQKSMQSRAKNMKISFVHRNRRKSTFGKSFFIKKSIFAQFLDSLWVPGGLPGPPGSLPESIIFLINLQLRPKTGPDGGQGVPREAPGVPRGTPRVPFWVEFWIDFTCQKTFANAERLASSRRNFDSQRFSAL